MISASHCREIEQLSDLSDVSEKSDLPSDEDSSEGSIDDEKEDLQELYDDYGRLMRRGRRSVSRKVMSDSSVQTDDLELQSPLTPSTEVVAEVFSTPEPPPEPMSVSDVTSPPPEIDVSELDPDVIQKKVQEKIAAVAMDTMEEEDSEDSDPRFVLRPKKVVTGTEGESIKMECEVTGTPSIGEFLQMCKQCHIKSIQC